MPQQKHQVQHPHSRGAKRSADGAKRKGLGCGNAPQGSGNATSRPPILSTQSGNPMDPKGHSGMQKTRPHTPKGKIEKKRPFSVSLGLTFWGRYLIKTLTGDGIGRCSLGWVLCGLSH